MAPLNLAKAVTFFERGINAADGGNMDRAITAFKEALRIQPTYLEAKIALGQAYMDMGDEGAALEILLNAYAQCPTNPGVLAALGLVHFAMMEMDQAIGYWQQAFELSEEDLPPETAEEIGTTLSTALLMMEEYDGAARILAQLDHRLPNSLAVQTSYAEFYYAQQQYDDSLRHAEQAARLDAEDAEVQLLIGKIQLAREAYPLAFSALASARKLDPDLPGLDATLAQGYLQNDQYDEALKVADSLLQQDELDRDDLFSCALVYMTIGNAAQAESLLREILEDDPDDVDAGASMLSLAESTKNLPLLHWCRDYLGADDPDLQAAIDECIQRVKPGGKILRPQRKHR